MKKTRKLILIIIALILISLPLSLIFSFTGNPLSKLWIDIRAEALIQSRFPSMDLELNKAVFNFKNGKYQVFVQSKSSKDTYFSVYFNWKGELVSDNYENYVLSGHNTWERLDSQYRKAVEDVFQSENFPHTSSIDYGELKHWNEESTDRMNMLGTESYGIKIDELILDGEYDIFELAKATGHLVYYAESDVITPEKAAEILLDIKNHLDAAGVSFYSIDFVLEEPREKIKAEREAATNAGEKYHQELRFNIEAFRYDDFGGTDFINKLIEADKRLNAYYEMKDAERQ